jgi:hypothetical protein
MEEEQCNMQDAQCRTEDVHVRRAGLACMLNFAFEFALARNLSTVASAEVERHAANDALALAHRDDMIGGKIRNDFRRAARPSNLQALGSTCDAESEMCTQVVLGQIART